MTEAMMQNDGLFPSSVPTGPYPAELLVHSQQAAGLRYVLLGEEGEEELFFFGHPEVGELITAVRSINFTRDNAWPERESDVAFGYARIRRQCPRHAVPDLENDCMTCEYVAEGGELGWPLEADEAAHPEAFPVAVWSVRP